MNDFTQCLQFSLDVNCQEYMDVVKRRLHGISVRPSTREEERCGIDIVVMLRRGALVYVDIKTRRPGAQRYWKHGEPEIPCEIWSVVEKRIIGWTLDESKLTDYVFIPFHERDFHVAYLIPFQLQRIAFRSYYHQWIDRYGITIQRTTRPNKSVYCSQAVFVPASVLMDAIHQSQVIVAA